MKILLASIPATGHFNPILVAAQILKEAGSTRISLQESVYPISMEAA
jgi:hypothetical protein